MANRTIIYPIDEVSFEDVKDYCTRNSINSADLFSTEHENLMKEIQINIVKEKYERFVLKKHLTRDGISRAITLQSNGQWSTVNPTDPKGKNKIRANTYDLLIYKLYSIYSDMSKGVKVVPNSHFSMKKMFEEGCRMRMLAGKMCDTTKIRHQKVCKSYFPDEFMKKSIKSVTHEMLLQLLDQIVINKRPSLNEIKNIKGTLCVIYDYAVSNGIVPTNYAKLLEPKYFYHKVEELEYASNEADEVIEKVFSPEEAEALKDLARQRINKYKYNLAGFEVLFASITGCRSDEIPAFKWSDFGEYGLWIHAQQVEAYDENGSRHWVFVPYTKNEKHKAKRKGRYFPMIDGLYELLLEIKARQEALGIHSDYIFCKKDGSPSTCDSYRKALGRMCRKLEFKVTNNHAFRKEVNLRLSHEGYCLEERAYMLGHSTKVNSDKYSAVDDGFAKRATETYRKLNPAA